VRRALLLAWLLAGGAMAAGNFSFDVTSSADDNWVKIAADAAHRLPAVHSYVLSGYAATGVLQMPFHRYLDNQGTASNWFVRATAADLWLLTASSGGVGGAGYDPIGAGATTNFTIVGLSFDSAVSAITYLDGVVGETDTTVAATDNPVQGVRIGCGDTGPGDTCNAANDHRGEIGDVAQDQIRTGNLGVRQAKLSVREVEALAQERAVARGKPGRSRPRKAKDADTAALEKRLSDALGLVVQIAQRGSGGELRVRYKTLEQLDALCRRLGVRT